MAESLMILLLCVATLVVVYLAWGRERGPWLCAASISIVAWLAAVGCLVFGWSP
jgi:hypothetical protein